MGEIFPVRPVRPMKSARGDAQYLALLRYGVGRRPVGSNHRAAGSSTVKENSQGRTWTATNVRR